MIIGCFKSWPAMMALVASLFLGITACGIGPAWKGSVKVGLVLPFYGYDSGSANAAYLAAKLILKERNEDGGIGGRWVELVALDDQNSPDVAAHRAREMVLDPAVLGVAGHLSSDTALAAAAGYREAGLAAITLGGSAEELGLTFPELLRMAPDDEVAASRALQIISQHIPLRRIAVVYDRSPGHSAAAKAFLDVANRLNLETRAKTGVERDQRDFASFFSALFPNPPELLIFVGDQFQAASFVAQARGAALVSRILIAGCADTPDFATIGRGGATGVLHTGYAAGADSAEAADFAGRYQSSHGQVPNTYALAAGDAMRLLLDAIARALRADSTLDRASVARQIRVSRVGKFGEDGGRNGVEPLLFEIDESGFPGKLWR